MFNNEYDGEIRQIIVLSDGRSNIGMSPIAAAANASKAGIVVSTIGIMESGCSREEEVEELEGIAKAGGGLCEYTYINDLGRTMQLMTQKTAQKTIEQIVSKQLKNIIGVDVNELEPKSRFKIIEFIEKYGENINLKCVVLLDSSGSMEKRMESAKKSLKDLLINLNQRKGTSSIAVIAYPGEGNSVYSIMSDFTDNPDTLEQRIKDIRGQGGTPTGPAIEAACTLLQQRAPQKNKDEVNVEYGKTGTEEFLRQEAERYYV